ncbi:MAG: hypothetical protein JF922_02515 [Candidatus Dormibacteraeota bacterium]|uniref:Uncharacterized protein n=1 Tax=Candidatus Nephthysia bennettiae TaxID=3127016 RepID=A0A934K7B3_9BACT|nr:hypothetical protein [Candidatus Dormibacteraeota bacterium]MBJ7611951.1 hypothetical protein [Candidatus Dormibacteraeota bacterium]
MQRPPHVPLAPEIAVPAAGGPGEPSRDASSCDFTLELGSEFGRRLLVNSAGEGQREPIAGRAVLVWAPLPEGRATALALPAGPGPEMTVTSGSMSGTLEFIEQARGPLQRLTMVQANSPTPCCDSALLVELATDELVLRAALHEPAAGAAEELRRLRPEYSQREASDWAVCEWNSRLLDPVEAAGILLVDAQLAGGASPQVYLLWRDVDGAARAWEGFGELPDPGLLHSALRDHFRYVARDEQLLVVDRSPVSPVGRRGPLSEELVHTAPFARPPLPEIQDAHGFP